MGFKVSQGAGDRFTGYPDVLADFFVSKHAPDLDTAPCLLTPSHHSSNRWASFAIARDVSPSIRNRSQARV